MGQTGRLREQSLQTGWLWMHEIEHRHLRYAIAAADLGSFRQTATKFNIRQSAISRRIRDLENQLGATLFDRTTSGVVPTTVGRAFLERARVSLTQLNEAAEIAAESGRGVLRIGFDASCGASFVTALLGRFVSRHRRTHPVLVEAAVQDLLAGIRTRRLDVALLMGWPEVPHCNVIQLWLDRVVAVLPENNSLARKATIHWRDLMEMSFLGGQGDIGTVIHECLTRGSSDIGYDPKVEHLSVRRDMLMGMVSLGRGFSLTTQSMPEGRFAGVVYRPIFAPGAELPFNAVTSDLNDTQTLRSFLRMAFLARTSSGH